MSNYLQDSIWYRRVSRKRGHGQTNSIPSFHIFVGAVEELPETKFSKSLCNKEDEEVMDRYGLNKRNVEGQMVVEFAKRMEMAVVNTYFKKKEEHSFTKILPLNTRLQRCRWTVDHDGGWDGCWMFVGGFVGWS